MGSNANSQTNLFLGINFIRFDEKFFHIPWGGAWWVVFPGPYIGTVTGKNRPPAYS